MRCWQMIQQGLKSLFLIMLILVSCSAPDSDNPAEGCGGLEASVSCLEIVSIAPTSTAGGSSSNVDAFQELCVDPTTGQITSTEAFTDHNASITFSNMLFPTATGTGFDIRITGYAVSYSINQCPATAQGCPPLTGFTVSGESILVLNGQTVVVTLPFVPLRVKDAFCASGGELGRGIPSYTATYTFTAQTTRFNDTFTVTGRSQFTIGDFVDSSFSCAAPGIVRIAGC
ncbi:MAG: hypothetical protein ACRD5H_17170 [Nitrososphaerales archaeon]